MYGHLGTRELLCRLDSEDCAAVLVCVPPTSLCLYLLCRPHDRLEPELCSTQSTLCHPSEHVPTRHTCTPACRTRPLPLPNARSMASEDESSVVGKARKTGEGALHTCTPLLPSRGVLQHPPTPQGSWLALQVAVRQKPWLSGCRWMCELQKLLGHLLSALRLHVGLGLTVLRSPAWEKLGLHHPHPHVVPA